MKKPEIQKESKAIKLSLSVPERINLPALLPPKSSRAGNALSDSMKSKVEIKEEEKKELGFVMLPKGRYFYNPSKKEKEFEFEPFEILHIQQGIRIHDLQETISNDDVTKVLVERLMDVKVG